MDKLIASLMNDYIPFFLFLTALGFGDRQITEFFKKLIRKIPGLQNFGGDWSWVLALVFGGLAIYGFDVSLFSKFESWQSVDPELMNLIQVFLVSFVGNKIHDKYK